jgi:hypothetical protein
MSSMITITGGNTHPDGLLLGSEPSEKVGFHGKEPVIQSSGADLAAVEATSTDGTASASAELAALAAETEKIGDDARAAIALVNALRTALVDHGIIAGA